MVLKNEPLADGNLDEVIAFFRDANPAVQKTWGWDTGRFVDWRWGSNSLREAANPGWFASHCRVFREGSEIRAVAVSEYGGAATCIATAAEEPEVAGTVLEWLTKHRMGRGVGLSFEISDAAGWLRSLFWAAGMVEETNTGCEWEYELGSVSEPAAVPAGFTVESLTDDRAADYVGIAGCIRRAFNIDRDRGDMEAALRSLEANPLFRPELSVFVRSPDGRVAAYCRGTVDQASGVCGIDPVCCHPDFWRMGLSKAVVQTCFSRQRRLGGTHCYIGSEPEPAPGTFLYRSLGPVSRTVCCTWSLPAPGEA